MSHRQIIVDEPFKFPVINNPEDIGAIEHIGRLGETNEAFYSFDPDKVTVQENDPAYGQKIYDNESKEDCEVLKKLLSEEWNLRRRLTAIEDKITQEHTLANWLISIIDKDENMIGKLKSIRQEQDNLLKDLGFPGLSIYY